jgi:hypothetical protein
MPGFAPIYGRFGQQASGDPMVADLLTRTVENQYRVTGLLDQLMEPLAYDGNRRWLAPSSEMVVLQSHWVAAMLWQMATAYLDAVVNHYMSFGQLPRAVYQECDSLCDYASSMTLQAIQLKGRLTQRAALPQPNLAELPKLDFNGEGYAGALRALEAVYLQVSEDIRVMQNSQVPKKMQPVYTALMTMAQPDLDAFVYLRDTWRTTRVEDNRRQIVRDAARVIGSLYAVGQKLCSPMLLGALYTNSLNYRLKLEELEIGFDPWILTDLMNKPAYMKDPTARQTLADFWETVANPAAARQVAEALQSAVQNGHVMYRGGFGYRIVPWPGQYLVRFPMQFGPRSFNAGDLIAIYVNRDDNNKAVIEVRRTGRLNSPGALLGQ